tara:strand:- start:6418 stop:7029 length:612 start_codon:yes stop_codon:yes gene_type:complete
MQKIIVNLGVSLLEFETDKVYVVSSEKTLTQEEAFKVAVGFAQTCYKKLSFNEEEKAFTDVDGEILIKVTEVKVLDSEDGFIFEELAPSSVILADIDSVEPNMVEVEKYLNSTINKEPKQNKESSKPYIEKLFEDQGWSVKLVNEKDRLYNLYMEPNHKEEDLHSTNLTIISLYLEYIMLVEKVNDSEHEIIVKILNELVAAE